MVRGLEGLREGSVGLILTMQKRPGNLGYFLMYSDLTKMGPLRNSFDPAEAGSRLFCRIPAVTQWQTASDVVFCCWKEVLKLMRDIKRRWFYWRSTFYSTRWCTCTQIPKGHVCVGMSLLSPEAQDYGSQGVWDRGGREERQAQAAGQKLSSISLLLAYTHQTPRRRCCELGQFDRGRAGSTSICT